MTIAGVLAPLPEGSPPETMVVCSTTDRTGAPLLLSIPLGVLQAMAPSGRTLAEEALHQEAMEKAKADAEVKKAADEAKKLASTK